jgi:hypothetical protein
MPKKPKKAKGDNKTDPASDHKDNNTAQRLDDPSSSHASQHGEKGHDTQRYASITGTQTPPLQEAEVKI